MAKKKEAPANETKAILKAPPVGDDLLERAREAARVRAEQKKRTLEDAVRLKKSEPPSVSAGPIDQVVPFIFNPSRDKIREVTVVDRVQGRLLPQLDMLDLMWDYVLEVAAFRQDAVSYRIEFEKDRPEPPALIKEFVYRTAQWQKSVGGTNMKAGIDLALAEIETKSNEEDIGSGGFPED